MAKTIIKELIIILLLCLAMILILGILLYEYVPMAKTLPNQVAYVTPSNVKEELAGGINEDTVIRTYEVNSDDLNNYKKIQNYKPGKANPFSSYETPATNTESQNSSGGENGNTTSNSSNTNQNTNSATTNTTTQNTNNNEQGRFFQNKGTK